MTPSDRRSGLGELVGALILSLASLVIVLWIVAVSGGGHALFAATSQDAPEPGANVTGRTRPER